MRRTKAYKGKYYEPTKLLGYVKHNNRGQLWFSWGTHYSVKYSIYSICIITRERNKVIGLLQGGTTGLSNVGSR